jgi:hypothetical protein
MTNPNYSGYIHETANAFYIRCEHRHRRLSGGHGSGVSAVESAWIRTTVTTDAAIKRR